jgi:hypothetical protein
MPWPKNEVARIAVADDLHSAATIEIRRLRQGGQ